MENTEIMKELMDAERSLNVLSDYYTKLAGTSTDIFLYKRYLQGLSPSVLGQLERMIAGQELPQIHMDIIAKRIFHPDIHPDRLSALIRGVTKEHSLEIEGSFTNEGVVEAADGKRIIFDLPARMSDGRIAIVEIQVVAQEYIPERTEIYSANALTRQYMVARGQKKTEYDFRDVKDIYVIVLMVKSPMIFREHQTVRYIHTALRNTTDTGIIFHALQHNVFIQLDKCLEQLEQGVDGEENPELQLLLSAIADINNDTVKRMSENDRMLREIRRDLYELSQNKEVQISMLEAKFAEADWAAALSESRKEGIRQGKEIGLEQGKEIGLEQGKVIGLEQGKEIGLEQGKVIGLEQGEAIGREKGEELRLIRQVCTKLKKQKPMSVIAEELEEDPLYIQRICKAAEKHAPEYDSWDIYTEMNAGQEAE